MSFWQFFTHIRTYIRRKKLPKRQCTYKKFVSKMLMKLTPIWNLLFFVPLIICKLCVDISFFQFSISPLFLQFVRFWRFSFQSLFWFAVSFSLKFHGFSTGCICCCCSGYCWLLLAAESVSVVCTIIMTLCSGPNLIKLLGAYLGA
jgi:hypothetical protein